MEYFKAAGVLVCIAVFYYACIVEEVRYLHRKTTVKGNILLSVTKGSTLFVFVSYFISVLVKGVSS